MGGCVLSTKKKKVPKSFEHVMKKNYFYSISENSWKIILDFLKYKELQQSAKLNRSLFIISRSTDVLTKFFQNRKNLNASQSVFIISQGEMTQTRKFEINNEFTYSSNKNFKKNTKEKRNLLSPLRVLPSLKKTHEDTIDTQVICIQKPKCDLISYPKNINTKQQITDLPLGFNVNHMQSTAYTLHQYVKTQTKDSNGSECNINVKGIESGSENKTPSFRLSTGGIDFSVGGDTSIRGNNDKSQGQSDFRGVPLMEPEKNECEMINYEEESISNKAKSDQR